MVNQTSSVSQGLERAPGVQKGSAPLAFKAVRSLASLLHAVAGVSWVYIPGTEWKHAQKHTHTKQPSHKHYRGRDNGVYECGGAAPGSAQAGLGTAALQTGRSQEENHPAEEIFLGEDDVQEELGQRRGLRGGHYWRTTGNSSPVSGTG